MIDWIDLGKGSGLTASNALRELSQTACVLAGAGVAEALVRKEERAFGSRVLFVVSLLKEN